MLGRPPASSSAGPDSADPRPLQAFRRVRPRQEPPHIPAFLSPRPPRSAANSGFSRLCALWRASAPDSSRFQLIEGNRDAGNSARATVECPWRKSQTLPAAAAQRGHVAARSVTQKAGVRPTCVLHETLVAVNQCCARRHHLVGLTVAEERAGPSDGVSDSFVLASADLSQHRQNEIRRKEARARLIAGDERNHRPAAGARHHRAVARRELSRNRRNGDVQRPHELELLRRELRQA